MLTPSLEVLERCTQGSTLFQSITVFGNRLLQLRLFDIFSARLNGVSNVVHSCKPISYWARQVSDILLGQVPMIVP